LTSWREAKASAISYLTTFGKWRLESISPRRNLQKGKQSSTGLHRWFSGCKLAWSRQKLENFQTLVKGESNISTCELWPCPIGQWLQEKTF
jgi:hypothetical protein